MRRSRRIHPSRSTPSPPRPRTFDSVKQYSLSALCGFTIWFTHTVRPVNTSRGPFAPLLGFLPTWPKWTVTLECEGGALAVDNYVLPSVWQAIRVSARAPGGGRKTRTEKRYGWEGGPGWWPTCVSLHFVHELDKD